MLDLRLAQASVLGQIDIYSHGKADLQIQCLIRTQAVQYGMQLITARRQEKELSPEAFRGLNLLICLERKSIQSSVYIGGERTLKRVS